MKGPEKRRLPGAWGAGSWCWGGEEEDSLSCGELGGWLQRVGG